MAIDIHITVLTGVSAGDVFHFPLEVGSSVIIGRATECDLVLQDPLVSRRHIEIQYLEEGFFISDLGSTHGTFHMGFHVQPGSEGKRLLAKDDEFKIGELLFRVSLDRKSVV